MVWVSMEIQGETSIGIKSDFECSRVLSNDFECKISNSV